MTSKKIYNWGILGTGQMANRFAEGLKVLPKANCYAVGSRSQLRADDFAAKHNFKHSYGSYDALVSDPAIDIIYIATPHSEHRNHTILSLENNKHVLCEKPFAINARESKEMIDLARKKKLFLMDAIFTRFLPCIQQAEDIVHSGRLGTIRLLKADYGFLGNPDPEGRLMNPMLGGGSLLDVGIYPLFFSLLFFGQPDKIKAMATLTEQGIDTSCSVILKYDHKGILSNIFSSFVTRTHTEAIVYGSRGKLVVNRKFILSSNLTIIENNEKETLIEVPFEGNGYNYEAGEVMRCLDEGKTESKLLPLKFTQQLMELMDKIRRQCHISYPGHDELIF